MAIENNPASFSQSSQAANNTQAHQTQMNTLAEAARKAKGNDHDLRQAAVAADMSGALQGSQELAERLMELRRQVPHTTRRAENEGIDTDAQKSYKNTLSEALERAPLLEAAQVAITLLKQQQVSKGAEQSEAMQQLIATEQGLKEQMQALARRTQELAEDTDGEQACLECREKQVAVDDDGRILDPSQTEASAFKDAVKVLTFLLRTDARLLSGGSVQKMGPVARGLPTGEGEPAQQMSAELSALLAQKQKQDMRSGQAS